MSRKDPSSIISFAMMVGSATFLIFTLAQMVYQRFKNPIRPKEYTGQYDANDQYDGFGRLLMTDGSAYEGTFVKGQYEGLGQYRFPDGMTILSKFHQSVPTGVSRKQLVGGASMEGLFVKDAPHGFVYSRIGAALTQGVAVYNHGERSQWLSISDTAPSAKRIPALGLIRAHSASSRSHMNPASIKDDTPAMKATLAMASGRSNRGSYHCCGVGALVIPIATQIALFLCVGRRAIVLHMLGSRIKQVTNVLAWLQGLVELPSIWGGSCWEVSCK